MKIMFLLLLLLLPWFSAAPLNNVVAKYYCDSGGNVKGIDIDTQETNHNVQKPRGGRIFDHSRLDLGDVSVGSAKGNGMIGNKLNVNVKNIGNNDEDIHDQIDGGKGKERFGQDDNDDVGVEEPGGKVQDRPRQVFKLIDGNKDEIIDVKELLSFCQENDIHITKTQAEAVVTVVEFLELLEHIPNLTTVAIVDLILSLLHKEGSLKQREEEKQLNREESQPIVSLFKSMDTNKDQIIDAMEFLEAYRGRKIDITESDYDIILRDEMVGVSLPKFVDLLKLAPLSNDEVILHFIKVRSRGRNHEDFERRLQHVFMSLDSDTDCTLSVTDLFTSYHELGKEISEEDALKLLNLENDVGMDFQQWKRLVSDVNLNSDNGWRELFNYYNMDNTDAYRERRMDASVETVAKAAVTILGSETAVNLCGQAELVGLERARVKVVDEGFEYHMDLRLALMEGEDCEDETVKVYVNIVVLKPLPDDCAGLASLKLINQALVTSHELCITGESNSAECYCAAAESDDSGEVCAENQRCSEYGLCFTGSVPLKCGFQDNYLIVDTTSGRSPHSRDEWFTWQGGRIPYYFKGGVTQADKTLIRDIMDEIENNTCLQYIPHDEQPLEHHLEIIIGTPSCRKGFSAFVKPIIHVQPTKVRLQSKFQLNDYEECDFKGGVSHEMLHVLGVGHTHKRKDRDTYVNVIRQNINVWAQYEICQDCALYDNVPYDCGSIMHYGWGTFSKGREPTMESKNPDTCKLSDKGPPFVGEKRLSASDWKLLEIIATQLCDADKCNGIDDGCCTKEKPCQENDGDCDNDEECSGDLSCGNKNCAWGGDDDCCFIKPTCCSKITLKSSHNDWHKTYLFAENIEGGWTVTGKTVNGWPEYQSDNNRRYCLRFNENKRWIVNECRVAVFNTGFVFGDSSSLAQTCPYQVDRWSFYSQNGLGWVEDGKITTSCEIICNFGAVNSEVCLCQSQTGVGALCKAGEKCSIDGLCQSEVKSWSETQDKTWSEAQDKIWSDDECPNVSGGPMGFLLVSSLEDCKTLCLEEPSCTAIISNTELCVLRSCPFPIPAPTYLYPGFNGFFIIKELEEKPPPCKCGSKKRDSRIVSGSETEVNEYPWMVLIIGEEAMLPDLMCGGAVIADKWVISAAHCFIRYSPSSVKVILGEHDKTISSESLLTKEVIVDKIITHESFDPAKYTNDVALLRVPTGIDVNIYTPVCLPPPGEDYTGKQVRVYGWGAVSEMGPLSNTLQELEITVLEDSVAAEKFGLSEDSLKVTLFAGGEEGKDACSGDSGGPLTHDRNAHHDLHHNHLTYDRNGQHELVGVTSWGYGCARAGLPGAYTEMSNFRNWIDEKIEEANTCQLST